MRQLRIALRTLLRHPSFAAMSIGTLALGIGATTAIFTVVNGVLLEPLPYPAPESLVRVHHPVPKLNAEWRWGVSEAGFFAFRESSRSLEDLAVYERWEMVLAGEAVAERVTVSAVSANVFEMLGARPVVGRLLRWDDNEPGAAPVVVLAESFWRSRFAADPGLVGATLRLEGRPLEVVGVVADGFDLPDAGTSVWYPVSISASKRPVNWHRFSAIGRLRPGVDADAAQRELDGLIAGFPTRLEQAYGGGFLEESGFRAEVVPLQQHVVGSVATALWVLLGAVGIVLLIGCVNVANLFLVRLEAGRRETAVRRALGASRRDVAVRSLAETMLLGLAAGGLALLLAVSGLSILLDLAPALPRVDEVTLGPRSVAFALGAGLLAGVVFGLMPLARSGIRFDWLREGVGLTPSGRRHAVRGGLVVFEMALALVLLMSAGLLLRTFHNLRSVDPGVDPEGVLTVEVSLPYGDYESEEAVAGFYRTVTERIGALPGVVSVGGTQSLPLASSGAGCTRLFTRDPADRERMSGCFASPVRVTPGYFDALGIAVRGEKPAWEDMEARRGGVVVTRAFAEHVWPGQDPIGKTVRGNGQSEPYYSIVGVADDVRARGLDRPPVPRVYFPMLALEGAGLWQPPHGMVLAIRTGSARPEALTASVRSVIRDVAPSAAIGGVRPMTAVVASSMARTSFAMMLLGIAAAVALALGVIGLYGVVSYVTEQRRGEIGIRMALGAEPGWVRRMVVGQAARLAGLGIAVGGAASLLGTRVLASQLYDVPPGDPLTLVVVAALLLGVALAAAFVPARRASRVEPMRVLRGD